MISAIHQSMLNMALRCGEQFRRRYMEGEVIPPGIAAGRGTGLHYANKVNLTAKIRTGEDLPISDIKDATRDGYVRAFQSGVYLKKDDLPKKDKLLNDGLDDALRCAEVYRSSIAPDIKPVTVEQPFKIDVGLALPLAGTMDIQQDARVDDLKTAAKKWNDGQIEKEIQPPFYSLAYEIETQTRPTFHYHIMIARRGKDGTPTSTDYQTQEMTPTDAHYSALYSKLDLFIKMVQAGLYPPANPASWWCSPDWCGYYYTCSFVGNGKQSKWI